MPTQFCALVPVVLLALTGSVTEASDPRIESFEREIRPLLVKHCYECHAGKAESIKGGLRLDSREAARRGGDSGPAVVPGKPEESLLLSAVRYESFEMPPQGKLPDKVIAALERWIRAGAHDPREEEGDEIGKSGLDWQEARSFWAFQPPTRHALPTSETGGTWHRSIDAFIARKLQAAGIAPNPEADRRTLIRRVSFDLTGLPPTYEEVERFVEDSSPNAYERLVDRLLASPRYGERWARMWLDVARYAEDQAHIVGNNTELCYPNAYLYRDWVIEKLNSDMPYDEFVRSQLAADLIAPDDQQSHIALGFLGLGPKYYRRNDPEVMAEEWEDRVDTVTRGLLGVTVACARCHDHKYDPIPTEDYYALAGVFASTEMFNRPLESKGETKDDGQAKKPEEAVHIVRDLNPHDLHVAIRGDVKKEGPLVKRHFLTALSTGEPAQFNHGSGRLDLANEIVDRHNPLTARVIVNRVWALHFGRPLVATPSNFGSLGERPTHPQLLDDLAVRFMEAGWSLKWLQREIVLSATYRQSSDLIDEKQTLDPANLLLWRMNRRRLSVEAWRDALLMVTGQLDATLGGKSIEPQSPEQRRRTVYSYVSRLDLDSMLALFDFPDPNVHSARRAETTTPLQKLFVLNSPLMVHHASELAGRLLSNSTDEAERVTRAYQVVFGRTPSGDELHLALEFLKGCDGETDQARWAQYAQVLLASNEMVMLD